MNKKEKLKKSKNSFDWQSKRFYLEIADEDYLGARTLCLIGIYLPAGVLAQQAVEKYIKLKLIELKNRTTSDHNLLALFKSLENHDLKIKNGDYYKDLLEQLTNSYNWKYFDYKGLLGAINRKNETITTGLGKGLLKKFDELCMELRNTLLLFNSSGTPVSRAINSRKVWSRGKFINLGWSFHTENDFAKSFKIRR